MDDILDPGNELFNRIAGQIPAGMFRLAVSTLVEASSVAVLKLVNILLKFIEAECKHSKNLD